MERERIIEILLAMILLVLVFFMIVVGLAIGDSQKNTSKTIINSYNTIDTSEKNYYQNKEIVRPIVYYKETDRDWETKKTYIWDNWYKNPLDEKDYRSYGRHTKTYEMNSYVDVFKIYVYNQGPSKYFTVRLYFEDYEGNEKSYDIRKYIKHDEEKTFYFRDISNDKYEYYRWKYKIFD